ncbi:FAD-dependent oxidoreductase [Burkholderia sp. R-69980]|nr:FAD-dependent oxidoreductase [Burkholderia sp. R-69980]
MVIIGSGQAAGELAAALRQERYDGTLVMVGEEPQLPYQRPPLSKAYLAGKVDSESLHVRPRATFEKAGIELMLGVRVESVDRERRQVILAGGREIEYSTLAFTTGGRPRRLSVPGANHPLVHYLRTIADVDAIRRRMVAGARLVIIGGGYIGLEVASVAVRAGLHVTVLEAAERVLARVTAPEVSAFYEQVHRDAGVEIRTGAAVTSIDGLSGPDDMQSAVVVCGDGTRFEADLIIAGIGLIPNTDVAKQAGLTVDDGIVVDEYARTSDPNIVAAGDCTRHPNRHLGRHVRLESVPNAMEQARVAAATLCGRDKPYHSVPWFWSDQYDLKLQMVGISSGYERLVLRGSLEKRSFAAFYLKDDHILAADFVNRLPDFMVTKRLVAERVLVSAEYLADETRPLKALIGPGVVPANPVA